MNGWPIPTDRECYESCLVNAQEVKELIRELIDQYRRLDHGDIRIVGDTNNLPLRVQIKAAKSDAEHWDELARWYRGRLPDKDEELPF